jgi:hypothetical protein
VLAGPALAGNLSTTGPVTVYWDRQGAFVFGGVENPQRYDARTGEVKELPNELDGFVELTPSRTSPDGSSTANVKLGVATGQATWKDGVFTMPGKGDHQLLVNRGAQSWLVAGLDAVADAQTYWSPDGHYVAFVVRSTLWSGGGGMYGVEGYVGAAGPRVQVLAVKDVLAAAKAPAVKAVEVAGGVVVFAGPAKKARERSVIYAAKGSEALAKAIAVGVPGGATVEALSWKTEAEVVVALGASAKGGK